MAEPGKALQTREGELIRVQLIKIAELEARENLSRLAMAGGTDEALVITTDEPITERLLAVLDELRRSATWLDA